MDWRGFAERVVPNIVHDTFMLLMIKVNRLFERNKMGGPPSKHPIKGDKYYVTMIDWHQKDHNFISLITNVLKASTN